MKLPKKGLLTITIVGMCFTFLGNDGCNERPQQSLSGAEQMTSIYKVPTNSHGLTVEQQNYEDRMKVTNDPTKILWIHLINYEGKMYLRMPVRCKTTSSEKRPLPKTAVEKGAGTRLPVYFHGKGSEDYYYTEEIIGPDGMWGSSDAYQYWFDPMGRYHQLATSGTYLLTDYPIDLRDPIDEITGLYNAHKAAAEWQLAQEKLLATKEGKK